jgi:FkbM family methyltransferase
VGLWDGTQRNIPSFTDRFAGFQRKYQQNCGGVVILSLMQDESQKENLVQSLREKGFSRIIMDNVLPVIGDDIFQTSQKALLREEKHMASVLDAFSLLGDGLSREVFYQNMQAYLENKYEEANYQKELVQYFQPGVKLNKGFSRLVDCGAYTGDTLTEALKYGNLEEFYGFEPDPVNFGLLSTAAGEKAEHIGKTVLFPCACGNQNEMLSFIARGSAGTLAKYKDIVGEKATILAVKLDDVLKKVAPTMIKMDIEGAEPDALAGAQGLIQTYQPDLAICVYHKMSHLWEIPLFLHALVPQYQFYLRCHRIFTFETVLYATVPKP